MKSKISNSFKLTGALVLATVSTTQASFIASQSPNWVRPTTSAQAQLSKTTYQEWDSFTSTHGTNVPSSNVNPYTTGNAFDSNTSSGSFLAGTDIYSFSGIITPQANISDDATAGDLTHVLLQTQFFGSDINTTDITISYTDSGDTLHSVPITSLSDYSYTLVNHNFADAGFGASDQNDLAWTFSIPATGAFKVNFGWDAVSSALQGVIVDTKSTPVPEPASLGFVLFAGIGLVGRSRR